MKTLSELSPRTRELMDILQEEAAEIVQAVSKIRRFGFESYHPNDPDKITNMKSLMIELGDLIAIVDLLSARDIKELGFTWEQVFAASVNKKQRIEKFLQTSDT